MLASNNLSDWITIIGIGELLAIIIFVIPKTMCLGTLLLSSFFGGAIVFHTAHPDSAMTNFAFPAAFLLFTRVVTWVRGLNLFG